MCNEDVTTQAKNTPSASSKYELLLINEGDAMSYLRNGILFILLRQHNINERIKCLQSYIRFDRS